VEVLDAARGELAWRITVPSDGRLPRGGAAPTLIQWKGTAHPTDRLPPSGVELLALRTQAPIEAAFSTPGGRRTLPPASGRFQPVE